MAVKSIRLFGDPVLRTPADPVVDFDKELRRLVADLTDTMRAAQGAGLAAPQLGVGLRVFVYEVGDESTDDAAGRASGHLVNPQLSFPDEEDQEGPEGCLSLPGLSYDCRRRRRVVARGLDMHGEPVEVVGSDLLARCVQHETDHLDGILFIDRLDPKTRKAALRAIREAEWDGQPPPQVKVSPHPMGGRAL